MTIQSSKSPIVALVLELCCGWLGIFASIGYFYIGQWQKGIAVILLFIVLLPLYFITGGVAYVVSWIIWPLVMVDVVMQAWILNRGGAIGQWTFFGWAAEPRRSACWDP